MTRRQKESWARRLKKESRTVARQTVGLKGTPYGFALVHGEYAPLVRPRRR